MNKIIHAVAASKKAEREGGGSSRTASGGPQPNFIVTLDGIDKNYFNASADGLISEHEPGILKLKKHDTNSQTVYIKTNKSQINLDDKVLKQPTFNVTDHSKSTSKERSSPTKEKKDEKRPSSSPSKTTSILRSSTGAAGVKTLEERRDSINRSTNEKPKAMVAPIRNSGNSTHTTSSSSSQSNSNGKSQRKRILPPENSPDHRGAYYPTSTLSSHHSSSSGGHHSGHPSRHPPPSKPPLSATACRYYPDCTKGSSCNFYPCNKGASSHPSSSKQYHHSAPRNHHHPYNHHNHDRSASSTASDSKRRVTVLPIMRSR